MGFGVPKRVVRLAIEDLVRWRTGGFWIAGTAAGSVIGPFGTFTAMNVLERVSFWGTIVAASLVIACLARPMARFVFGRPDDWQVDVATALLVATGLTPLVIVAVGEDLPVAHPLARYLYIFGLALFVSSMVSAFRWATRHRHRPGQEGAGYPAGEQADVPRLGRRLPEARPITRLAARDHYVHVYSHDTAVKLRMRLCDAIDEMEGVEGLAVHRSHWVARDAIDAVEREGARVYVRVVCGARVPVSRNGQDALREAGLL